MACVSHAPAIDVLVIGSGAAGLAAAVSAERAGGRVALATKTTLQANNSSKAQGGIQAAYGDDDSPEQHAEDVLRSSHGTADPALVEVLTSEARSAISWLEELGCGFTRENGGYRLARCGGATRKRLLQVGDRTGHAITKTLREQQEAGEAETLAHHRLESLEPDGAGWRATFTTPDGTSAVSAGAVVLASGGRCYAEAGRRGELSTNHPNATGETTRIALDAGAEARDLDALQYHPNGGAWPPTMQGYSIPETTRSYGAVLLNSEGEEFTARYGVSEEGRYVTTRDVATYAIVKEVEAGRGSPHGGAYLSFEHCSESALRQAFGPVIDRLANNQIDLTRMPIEVAPIAHYHMGGVIADERMATEVAGLFVAGEAVGGANGANRLSGNAITEALVFGRRAGRSAAERVKRMPTHPFGAEAARPTIDLIAASGNGDDLNTAAMIERLQATMADDVGPLRTQARLARALAAIDEMTRTLGARPMGDNKPFDLRRLDWFDLRNMLLVARAVTMSALARGESRGAHQREDLPGMLSQWRLNQVARLESGGLALTPAPVVTPAAAQ